MEGLGSERGMHSVSMQRDKYRTNHAGPGCDMAGNAAACKAGVLPTVPVHVPGAPLVLQLLLKAWEKQ